MICETFDPKFTFFTDKNHYYQSSVLGREETGQDKETDKQTEMEMRRRAGIDK